MMNIKPIKLLPAREQVAAELRKAILSNKYKQGDTIALDEVSKSLEHEQSCKSFSVKHW